jgi:hypothetical protein
MNDKRIFVPGIVLAAGIAALAASWAIAEASKDSQSGGAPEMKLPPGWTVDDMKACMIAGTPGDMHKRMANEAGLWRGKTTMWMAPDTEPIMSECTSTITPLMDGRFIKCETEGDMPGMEPFKGLGIYGFDNVSHKFISSWIDNQGTGITQGEGELSKDGKTLTWKMTFNCPITKKPHAMKEVDTITGPNTKTIEMFGADPKTGKHFQMMKIELTRK